MQARVEERIEQASIKLTLSMLHDELDMSQNELATSREKEQMQEFAATYTGSRNPDVAVGQSSATLLRKKLNQTFCTRELKAL